MRVWRFNGARAALVPLAVLVTITTSCRDLNELPTAPRGPAEAARAVSGAPTVNSVVPDSSKRNVTLDVTINGSGYDQGSVARFERQGIPASKVTTNSTTFVSSRKLIANITIAVDADTGKYDVAVLASDGRKGVGIEVFTVEYLVNELGVIGGTWSIANAINDAGEVVGESCTQVCLSTAFYWTKSTGLVDLGTLPGYSRSGAYAITIR